MRLYAGVGASVPKAALTLQDPSSGMKLNAVADAGGAFSLPLVPVGTYSLNISADGFTPEQQNGIVIDVGSAPQFQIVLQVASHGDTVNVTEMGANVEASDTQLGQVVSSKDIAAVPLNGRSYTDLLAVQGGVSPITTSGQTNNTSGGSFGYVPVSGGLTTGQFSVHGQRESANGFFLNGVSVQEAIGQQAGIIPDLASIAEFRVLTSNADAQYGGYSGGLVKWLLRRARMTSTAPHSTFCGIPFSIRVITSHPSVRRLSKTSLGERSAALSGRTSSFSSRIIRDRDKCRDRRPEL